MWQIDQDYYPGRRKRGKDYKEGMVGFDEFLKGLANDLTSVSGALFKILY
jgi:hypothetical protein